MARNRSLLATKARANPIQHNGYTDWVPYLRHRSLQWMQNVQTTVSSSTHGMASLGRNSITQYCEFEETSQFWSRYSQLYTLQSRGKGVKWTLLRREASVACTHPMLDDLLHCKSGSISEVSNMLETNVLRQRKIWRTQQKDGAHNPIATSLMSINLSVTNSIRWIVIIIIIVIV